MNDAPRNVTPFRHREELPPDDGPLTEWKLPLGDSEFRLTLFPNGNLDLERWVLDPETKELYLLDGGCLILSPAELDALAGFLRGKGTASAEILGGLWS